MPSGRGFAEDNRLRAAVANGAPSHHSFKAARNIGAPEIFIHTLTPATHARSRRDLMAKLQALSLKDRYAKISTPLLVINGENDTLLATEDSIDIATHAPGGLLNLYPAERNSQELWIGGSDQRPAGASRLRALRGRVVGQGSARIVRRALLGRCLVRRYARRSVVRYHGPSLRAPSRMSITAVAARATVLATRPGS